MAKNCWLPIALLGLFLAACSSAAAPAIPPDRRVGQPAPDFELPSLAGDSVRLSGLRGQVVLVNFWGTFCQPCVKEMPDLQRLYEKYRQADFTILAVDVEEKPAVVQDFSDRHGLTFPILLSRDASVSPTFAIRMMPTTWLIDRAGLLRQVWVGPLREDEAQKQIEALVLE